MTNNKFDLKTYLMGNFKDPRHPGDSIIEIFLFDPLYFDKLLISRKIHASAADFFSKNYKELKKTKGIHHELRKLKCNQLINNYIQIYGLDLSWEKLDQWKKDKDDYWSSKGFICPYDARKLNLMKVSIVTDGKGTSKEIPIFKCPICCKSFTYIEGYGYRETIRVSGNPCINLREGKRIKNKKGRGLVQGAQRANTVSKKEKKKCITYEEKYPEKCINGKCKGSIEKKEIIVRNKENQKVSYGAMCCSDCGTVYIPSFIYRNNTDRFIEIKNIVSIEEPKETVRNTTKTNGETNSISSGAGIKNNRKKNNHKLDVRDFIVRKTTFKCFHKNHVIEEIDAIVGVMNKNGEIYEREVSAGYCPQCNVYFMMESTYQKLKRFGILTCRVCDEKTYIHDHQKNNSHNQAPESLLMQYGYNVNQQNNLSEKQRRNILEMIVDNHIWSKAQVINMLDYHINNRVKQKTHKYDLAISKWESDRDYIERYKIGSHRKVIVGSISRKSKYKQR